MVHNLAQKIGPYKGVITLFAEMHLNGHQMARANEILKIQHIQEPDEFFKEVFLCRGPEIGKVDLGGSHRSSPFS